ncbi:hypothetical protein P153DRAFT_222059 [Dothidotthia symphoricarpi CBS 119687]|uniref:Uncharacterized protein n=1 Tax=Dothidotthia symphoricarpi CBS 119687 TaxID=1392245 RepID=A0A6A6AGD2_9PLEO|nr:uncharacterized protein P153DRAFT_222059 [Dothidotthia symphoricarpi CBS 119687]KAF2130626.1 hypothetical protein P153DRAFT_222059 [Dothidotthia symphoricarpi CBS 119687]
MQWFACSHVLVETGPRRLLLRFASTVCRCAGPMGPGCRLLHGAATILFIVSSSHLTHLLADLDFFLPVAHSPQSHGVASWTVLSLLLTATGILFVEAALPLLIGGTPLAALLLPRWFCPRPSMSCRLAARTSRSALG